MLNSEKTMDKIVALCKSRGFVYPGSEIYGGLANTWDYGPLGVELLSNVKKAWWKKFVQQSPYNVGLDSGILYNPQVWVASGHVVNFNDPLIDCKSCKMRHRADHLLESAGISAVGLSNDEMSATIAEHKVGCPNCGNVDFTPIRKFNMMFKAHQGVTEESATELYLRPETAQGIFVQFKNILRSSRKKIPFGVAQIGKAFRNEITPGNFTFRTREFEQMELEFFCVPGTDLEWFAYWKDFCRNWLLSLHMRTESLSLRDHAKEELSHYSNATTDIEFLYPFGWGELWGIADRTDFDLKSHQAHSGESLEYFDQEGNRRYIPYVIEPSLGATRMALAFLIDAYDEEAVDDASDDTRVVLKLHPFLSPIKAAILPLSKKLSEVARGIFDTLSEDFMCDFDDTGSIGKRYRRQDEIGTPLCVTYDFESEQDNCVTVRDRDTMAQTRIPIADLSAYVAQKVKF